MSISKIGYCKFSSPTCSDLLLFLYSDVTEHRRSPNNIRESMFRDGNHIAATYFKIKTSTHTSFLSPLFTKDTFSCTCVLTVHILRGQLFGQ